MLLDNFIIKTDSYKIGHWSDYPDDTEYVYSYFEARTGARFTNTEFFGLQPMTDYLAQVRVTQAMVEEAAMVAAIHFGDPTIFNRTGWEYIVNELQGKLPLKIMAVPEGTNVPVNNVLMTVVNTDPHCFWLTNALESFLTHVWYPSTVATLSKNVKNMMLAYLEANGDPLNINFMLHDFGYRGATTDDAAAIGGAGHLINFMGTDTLVAMALAYDYYDAKLESLGFSVPATEHSVMTSLGREGEYKVVQHLLKNHSTGILSCVADSYNIYNFTKYIISIKDQILARDGRFVLRPDSVTGADPTPESLVNTLLWMLWEGFGGEINAKGYKVLDPHIRLIWGDGIDIDGIQLILENMDGSWFSADNIVFGMGGGLLQKVNRDTQRFAFKSSAQCRSGVWYDIHKDPIDSSKVSKKGKLKLVLNEAGYATLPQSNFQNDELVKVFENSKTFNRITFDQVRENSMK